MLEGLRGPCSVPGQRLWSRLVECGAVVVGKTSTCPSSTGASPARTAGGHLSEPCRPWQTNGGSSSGSGAARLLVFCEIASGLRPSARSGSVRLLRYCLGRSRAGRSCWRACFLSVPMSYMAADGTHRGGPCARCWSVLAECAAAGAVARWGHNGWGCCGSCLMLSDQRSVLFVLAEQWRPTLAASGANCSRREEDPRPEAQTRPLSETRLLFCGRPSFAGGM